MELDIRKGWRRLRKGLRNFEVQPWQIITVSVVMVGLLVLGLVAWITSPAIAQVTELVITATPTLAPTEQPTRTPEPTATVSPSPTPVPRVQVVWTDKVSVYLLEEPGAGIIAAILNGEAVELREAAAQTAGGITWRPVRYRMVDGWLAQNSVYTLQSGYLQIGEPGTSLFRDPAGSRAGWLSPGTPYHPLELDESTQWQKISLPDGSAGWVNRLAEAVP